MDTSAKKNVRPFILQRAVHPKFLLSGWAGSLPSGTGFSLLASRVGGLHADEPRRYERRI
ncbi:hypothetical protein E2C01_019805 [Portunus trituberculatus]|uniref:Uncharacterized protein n=1 Tax=Portunus trituberculatus TaxID=210409 RepID=A0A5B7DYX6_PORTR|nr:hypothetical protein [Portunus trituberculatus]